MTCDDPSIGSLASEADIMCTSSRILLTHKLLKFQAKVRDMMREEGEDGSQARPRKAGGRKANGGTTTVVGGKPRKPVCGAQPQVSRD